MSGRYRKCVRRTIVERQRLDNGRVLLGSLLELLERDFGILVAVHEPEDLVDALRGERGTGARQRTFSGVFSSSGSLTIWPVIL